MLPIRLGLIKRTLYQLTTGISPSTALSAAATAPPASAAPTAAVTPSAQPLQFTDTAVADVIADIEAQAAAGPRLPTLPNPTKQDQQQQQDEDTNSSGPKDNQTAKPRAPRGSAGKGLQERRAGKGLLPGQWDPAAQEVLTDRRSRELLQRKSYLRNFWYAAGELGLFFDSSHLCDLVSTEAAAAVLAAACAVQTGKLAAQTDSLL
jgi:hypothetical protein